MRAMTDVIFDRVLAGGHVADGRGGALERADVGLRGDRIAAVGLGLQGRETVDCTGRVIAPGFIDAHSHSDLFLFADPILPMKVGQGVTCEVLGQDGLSVAPLRAEDVTRVRRQLAGLDGDPPGLEWSWRTVAQFLDAVRAARTGGDFCYLVPHGQVRRAVAGDENRHLTAAERDALKGVLREALAEGAVGFSTGLIYPPGCFADPAELVAIGEVLAEFDRPFVAHIRSEGDMLLESIEELLDVGRATGCHTHISHIKIAGRNNWLKLDAMLDTIEAARDAGLKVTADQYPYTAGSTMLGAILPPWVHDGGPDAAVERLGNPSDRARMEAQILKPGPNDWENFWDWSGAKGIVIADVPSGNRPELLGKSLAEAAGDADPLRFALDLLRDEKMGVAMISHSQDPEVVARLWARPWVCGGTDGLLGGRPHPRAYGAFPRMLAWLTRERRLCSLGEAIRKMAALPADVFGLHDLGTIEPGKRANLVVFDPERVADRSTWAEPRQLPAGIAAVLVGGRIVIYEGAPTGERPGGVHVAR
jgi:N-acyl-D-amino-acid deacylase